MACKKRKRSRKRRSSNPYSSIVKTTSGAAQAIVGVSAVTLISAKAVDALKT